MTPHPFRSLIDALNRAAEAIRQLARDPRGVPLMYEIVERVDGRFDCCCRIQDGTEHFVEDTREGAIAEMIRSAKDMNGATITADDIRFGRERWVMRPAVPTKVVSWMKAPGEEAS